MVRGMTLNTGSEDQGVLIFHGSDQKFGPL